MSLIELLLHAQCCCYPWRVVTAYLSSLSSFAFMMLMMQSVVIYIFPIYDIIAGNNVFFLLGIHFHRRRQPRVVIQMANELQEEIGMSISW